MTTPAGFQAAGVAAGMKKSGKPDLGLLVSPAACTSAAMYTPNAAAAAPVIVSREETARGQIRGIIVNSGSANACTGERGFDNARRMVRLAAGQAGLEPDQMAVASTGVIGVPLEMDLVEPGIAAAAEALSADGGPAFAQAIRTTDSLDKEGAVALKLAAGTVHIGACAKGAGMIAPNLATLLAFVTTDAGVPSELLGALLRDAVAGSFNAVTVDGDMSTNDCVFLLANGQSGVELVPGSPDARLFAEGLAAILKSLALKMVADGEGATKVIELRAAGAASASEAVALCRSIATSPLVRTAFFGQDANWGRIMASAGAVLAGESGLAADIYYEDICVAAGGAAAEPPAGRLAKIMEQQEISVTLDAHRGEAEHTIYFCDLTHDYVTLNSEYST